MLLSLLWLLLYQYHVACWWGCPDTLATTAFMLVIQSRSCIVLIGFTGTIRSMAKWWLLVGFLSSRLSLKCIVLPISAMLVGIERQLMCCKRGTSSTSHACAANVYVDIRLPACIDPAKPDQNRRTTPPTAWYSPCNAGRTWEECFRVQGGSPGI